MSAIIAMHGCNPAARVAKAFIVCWDGVPMPLWSSGGPILCADKTANTVADGAWCREEPVLYLSASNENAGRVGNGARYQFGATIRRGL